LRRARSNAPVAPLQLGGDELVDERGERGVDLRSDELGEQVASPADGGGDELLEWGEHGPQPDTFGPVPRTAPGTARFSQNGHESHVSHRRFYVVKGSLGISRRRW
jgi:hypothetical protein